MGCIFVLVELTKGMNSGSLTISGRVAKSISCNNTKNGSISVLGVELRANFPIDECKIKNFICHKLRGLCI